MQSYNIANRGGQNRDSRDFATKLLAHFRFFSQYHFIIALLLPNKANVFNENILDSRKYLLFRYFSDFYSFIKICDSTSFYAKLGHSCED